MKKIESDYLKLYGDIPRDDSKRFGELLNSLNLTRASREKIFPEIRRIQNIKWKHHVFTIYLLPKGTPRPRRSRRSDTFYVIGARDNKEVFLNFLQHHDMDVVMTPCKFTCVSYLPIPKSMNNVDTILAELGFIVPLSNPDWDNLGKTYSDMIQDALILDDNLIIDGTSKKRYSIKPRIEIHIEYMEEFDCEYNEKKIRKRVKL